MLIELVASVTLVACLVLNTSVAMAGDAAPANKIVDLPTLADVKTAGAKRSNFLKAKPPAATTDVPLPKLDEYRKHIEPVLRAACVKCHGPKLQERDFRVDTLDPNLLHGDDVDWWLEVSAVISNGEMPPEGEDQLDDADRSRIVEWLSSEIQTASQVRRNQQGHSSFRRMSRYEYNYALQDLLGLPYNFAEDLPPETASEDGFTNSSEVLQMSAMQFGYFRELGRAALIKSTVQGEQPEPIYWTVTMEDASAKTMSRYKADVNKRKKQFKDDPDELAKALKQLARKNSGGRGNAHFKDLTSDATFQTKWGYKGAKYALDPTSSRPDVPAVSKKILVIPAKQKYIVELGNQVPDTGTLRIRIRASRTSDQSDKIPALQWEFGWQASNNSSAAAMVSDEVLIDAAPDAPQFYQWDIPLSEIEQRNPLRRTEKMGTAPNPSEYIKVVNTSHSNADVQIDYVEVTAPVYEQWPPASHRRIFIDSANKSDEQVYAREVLSNFMSQAWRRSVTDAEVDQKLSLLTAIRPDCTDFQEAMIEVLATVISSPKFLYISGTGYGSSPEVNSDSDSSLRAEELASRLSFFLWSSMPDDELLRLAKSGQLNNTDVLVSQTQRMLADPKATRFSKHFVRQWLGMQLLDFLAVDKKAYRQFDASLKHSMQLEPVEFFREVLKHNHSVMDFIHADYTVVNERLAQHYGLRDVYGNHFRKVSVPADLPRGGLLTSAGLLAMNSDGKDSHPLKRGIWMLESLLNDPPPPPPPAVPEIDLADPEIAKLTLKQRMEDHRNDAACMSCHAKIDPWGIAFENFDAIGSWRTKINNEPVDASSLLFNKQKLDGIDGLKRYLLANRQDQFATAMVHKLTTYAIGRPLTFSDRSDVDKLTANLRQQGDGLETLVKLVVTSEIFRSK